MSDLERAFLQQINAEPDNALHRLVYADWLEEQGSEKARQIRLWQRTLETPVHENIQALQQAAGAFEAIIESLPEPLQRRCLCDIAWRVLPLFEVVHAEEYRPRLALIATWRFSLGEIQWEELNSARDKIYGACRDLFSTPTQAAFCVATAAGSYDEDAFREFSRLVDQLFSFHENWQPLLIAVSYLLFGCNVLPDRFTLEKARVPLP